jgi:hypothetical protein
VETVQTVPQVPWSHPFIERLIGTIRREYLDRLFFWTADVSLLEIPSAWDLLSFQQVGDRLLTNDDLVGQQRPGILDIGTSVSFRSGIRALSALAPGDGHEAVARQAAVQWCWPMLLDPLVRYLESLAKVARCCQTGHGFALATGWYLEVLAKEQRQAQAWTAAA